MTKTTPAKPKAIAQHAEDLGLPYHYETTAQLALGGFAFTEGSRLVLATIDAGDGEYVVFGGYHNVSKAPEVARTVKRARRIKVISVSILSAPERP